MPRWWKLGLAFVGAVVVAFVVGWFTRNAAARGTDLDVVNALFGAVSVVANMVMAGAAIAAFALWRKQLTGASEHDVAMRTLNFAHRLHEAVAHGFLAIPEKGPNFVVESQDVDQRIQDLENVRKEATAVIADVRARWPWDNAGLISLMLTYVEGVHHILQLAKRKGGVSSDWLRVHGWSHHVSAHTAERVGWIVKEVEIWAAYYIGHGGPEVTQRELTGHVLDRISRDTRDLHEAAAVAERSDISGLDDE